MSLTIHFTDAETLDLTRYYVQIAEGGEGGARAEQEVVNLIATKLGEVVR